LSNALDKRTNKPLCDSVPHTIAEWNGIKVGILGLVESEWLDSLGCDTENIVYQDALKVGKEVAKKLKNDGAQVFIFHSLRECFFFFLSC